MYRLFLRNYATAWGEFVSDRFAGKLFGVDPFRVPKRDYMRGQQKIEWLDLFCIGLTRI